MLQRLGGLTIVALCALLTGQAVGQPAAESRPATAPAAGGAVPDLCKGAVDPYDENEERERFLKATGVDNELDATEFEAAKGKDNSFVRSFDRWESMLAFDKSGNRKIDWFEADAYRKDLRRRVLAAFDADNDGKLTGEERDGANRALARGKLAMAEATSRPTGIGRRGMDGRGMDAPGPDGMGGPGPGLGGGGLPDDPESIKKYDTDSDGHLSPEERRAAMRGIREEQRKQMLAQYDKDGDGKLSDEELAALRRDRGEGVAENTAWDETVRTWQLRHFDEDGDGKISEAEQAKVREFQQKFRSLGKEMERWVMGDPSAPEEQRQQIRQEAMAAGLKMMAKVQKMMDLDGDGKVSAEERQVFMQRARKSVQKWAEGLMDKYDADRNGRLDEKEREAVIEGLRKELLERAKKYDQGNKGRLTPDEAVQMIEDFAREIGIFPDEKPPNDARPEPHR
jgi:Ca2+-binding EF-hand superfamily protein